MFGVLYFRLGSNKKVQTEFTSVELLGAVSCGIPTLEEEYAESYVSLPVSMFGNEFFSYLELTASL